MDTNPLLGAPSNPLAADALAGFDRGYSEGGFFTPEATAWANRQPWYLPVSLPVNLLNNLTAIPSGLFRGAQAAVAHAGNQLSPKLGNDLASMLEVAPEAFRSGAMPVPEAAPVRAGAASVPKVEPEPPAPASVQAAADNGAATPQTVFHLPLASHLWDYFGDTSTEIGDRPIPMGAALGKVQRVDSFSPDVNTVTYHIPGDNKAYSRYEYDTTTPKEPTPLTLGDMMRGVPTNSPAGTHVTVTDINRGSQPRGTGGQILAQSLQAQGLAPISIRLANIRNADTLHQVGLGVPLENTTLGKMLSNTAQALGGSAEDFQWLRNNPAEKPSIQVKVNYDHPEQTGVPVAATGRIGYRDGEKLLEAHRLDNFRDYQDRTVPGSTWLDPQHVPTRWIPESQLKPF